MYVIWGAWHGILLVLHKDLKRLFPRAASFGDGTYWRRALNIFLTFNLLALGFMFFRSSSMENVGVMTTQIFPNFHLNVAGQFVAGYTLIVVLMVGAMIFHMLPSRFTAVARARFDAAPLIVQALILALVLFLCIQFKSSDIVPFIYLQY
ncbi:MAG: MBOAT family protein, partial [Paramuribaculum sp.]|nr:MBOAT family protein [Paramuribaculum sp.]